MRRSMPKNTRRVSEDKQEIAGPWIPPHLPEYEMQFWASRKTGNLCAGFYWNPPAECTGPIYRAYKERWVDITYCRYYCKNYKLCEARLVDTKGRPENLDTPQNRRKKIKGRRRS